MNKPGDFRKTLWVAVKILTAVVLIGFVFSRINLTDLRDLSKKISFAWIALSFIFFILLTLLKALEYWVLLERPTSYANLLPIVIWQNALSNFVANAAGMASYLAMLRVDENVRVRRATAAFIITKLGDLIAIAIALIVASAFVWAQIGLLRNIVPLLSVGFFLSAALFIVILLNKPLIKFVLSLIHKIPVLIKLPGLSAIIDILNLLEQQENARLLRLIGQGVCLSSLYFLVTTAWLLTMLKGLAFPLDLWPIIFVITLGQIISFLPIQVLGGLGVSEATNLYFYSIFGVAQAESAALLFAMRVLFYVMNAMILLYFPARAVLKKWWPAAPTDVRNS